MSLVAARWLHYYSTSILFGMSAYSLYAARGLAIERWVIRLAAIGALISGVAWLGCEAAEMSGDPRGAFDPATLTAVVTQTTFGRLWSFRLVLAVVIAIGAFFMPKLRGHSALLAFASGLLLVSLSGTGHAASEDALHRSSDILHLAAAGIWLGGLCALGLRIGRRGGGPIDPRLRAEVLRFSNVALVAVTILVATGIANAAFLIEWRQILDTAYGRVLLVKSALVLCMIGTAVVSRRRLRANAGPVELRRSVVLEQGFGALVLVATSVLGTLPPTGD
jgi:copper resistance protein D